MYQVGNHPFYISLIRFKVLFRLRNVLKWHSCSFPVNKYCSSCTSNWHPLVRVLCPYCPLLMWLVNEIYGININKYFSCQCIPFLWRSFRFRCTALGHRGCELLLFLANCVIFFLKIYLCVYRNYMFRGRGSSEVYRNAFKNISITNEL